MRRQTRTARLTVGMTDPHRYMSTFDDMRAWVEWRRLFVTDTVNLWEKTFVAGVFDDAQVADIKTRVADIIAKVDWIQRIHDYQQRCLHDIVKISTEAGSGLDAVCSCGLSVTVPDKIARRYGRHVNLVMFTYQSRRPTRDRRLERWFFSQAGHRDPFYGENGSCFVSMSSTVNGAPHRDLVCTRCDRIMPFTWSGKFALYRPETYLDPIRIHRSTCLGRSEPDRPE